MQNASATFSNCAVEALVIPIRVWINTYENTIFRGMNIHLPAILMFTRGTRFWLTGMKQEGFESLLLARTLETPKVCASRRHWAAPCMLRKNSKAALRMRQRGSWRSQVISGGGKHEEKWTINFFLGGKCWFSCSGSKCRIWMCI